MLEGSSVLFFNCGLPIFAFLAEAEVLEGPEAELSLSAPPPSKASRFRDPFFTAYKCKNRNNLELINGVIFISTLVEVGVPEISWSNSSSSSSSLTPSPPPPIGVVLSPLPEKHSVVSLQVDDVQLQTYKSTF